MHCSLRMLTCLLAVFVIGVPAISLEASTTSEFTSLRTVGLPTGIPGYVAYQAGIEAGIED